MISAPTNFNHISHLGPGDGIQKQRLLDLPTTIETADQTQTQQRVSEYIYLIFKMNRAGGIHAYIYLFLDLILIQ